MPDRTVIDLGERLVSAMSPGPWSVDAFNEVIAGEPDYSAMILGADGESILAQQISDADATGLKWLRNNAAALLECARAGRIVLDGLNARIDAADPSAVPVFTGIAELHSALAALEGVGR